MARVIINNDYDKIILKGKSYLFKDYDAAMRQSKRVTTNPKILTLQSSNYSEQYYLACGEHWIANDGSRGQYFYGRGGRLVELINDDEL